MTPSEARRPTVWITATQLNPGISSLAGLAPGSCVVLMVESVERSRKLPYHYHKLILLWSAMRHFAEELRALAHELVYHEAADDFTSALREHIRRYKPTHLRLMEDPEYGADAQKAQAVREAGLEVVITPDTLFLSDRDDFTRWAAGKKQLVMEGFYRRMRRETGLLMEGDKPVGGSWNLDRQNRNTPKADHVFPPVPQTPPDAVTRDVMATVKRLFPGHFGTADSFFWPVTRADAEAFAADFMDNRLDLFGPYEDAICADEPAMYHSLLSPLINIGLLDPLALCRDAQRQFAEGRVRLNSAEGFIRQLIGWREYVYQVYRHTMPGYTERNFFAADLPLPGFYWDAQTDMYCIANAVENLIHRGINHHIQRLMITGNFALIAGIDPQAVNEWYWLAYADAYEWVVSPNVLGMALYADGGLLGTKPYAASAAYINKMSDCCPRCRYDHRQATGEDACPFNALFWDFLARNATLLKPNPRMNLMCSVLGKRPAGEMAEIRRHAAWLRDRLREGERF